MSGELRSPHPLSGHGPMTCVDDDERECDKWITCPMNHTLCIDRHTLAARSEMESDMHTFMFGVVDPETAKPVSFQNIMDLVVEQYRQDIIDNLQRPLWAGSPIGPLVRKPWHKRARNKVRNWAYKPIDRTGAWLHRKTERWCFCD